MPSWDDGVGVRNGLDLDVRLDTLDQVRSDGPCGANLHVMQHLCALFELRYGVVGAAANATAAGG